MISVFCKGAIRILSSFVCGVTAGLLGSQRGFRMLMAATISVAVFSLLAGMFVDSILPL